MKTSSIFVLVLGLVGLILVLSLSNRKFEGFDASPFTGSLPTSTILSTSFDTSTLQVVREGDGYALGISDGVRFGVEKLPSSSGKSRVMLIDPLGGKISSLLFPGKTDPSVVPDSIPGSTPLIFSVSNFRNGIILRDEAGGGWLGVSLLTGPPVLSLVPVAPTVWQTY